MEETKRDNLISLPDGKLFGKSEQVKGRLNRKFYWYYRNGAVHQVMKHAKGITIDTFKFYTKASLGYKPLFIFVFGKNGELLHFLQYGGGFTESYLQEETIYKPSKKGNLHPLS
jgi:hypothetical protein